MVYRDGRYNDGGEPEQGAATTWTADSTMPWLRASAEDTSTDQAAGLPPQPLAQEMTGQPQAPPADPPWPAEHQPAPLPPARWPARWTEQPGLPARPVRPPAWRPPERKQSSPGSGGGRRGFRFRWLFVAAAAILALFIAVPLITGGIRGLEGALSHIGIHLPSVSSPYHPKTTLDINNVVVVSVKGVDKPALGTATYTLDITHKVSKNIGPWPCWTSQELFATAHASSYVNLNLGPAWWAPSAGHETVTKLGHGHVMVVLEMPQPTLPTDPSQVSLDWSHHHTYDDPVQHSWTYPGFGCGWLLKPQFDTQVLNPEGQQVAYDLAAGKKVSITDVTVNHATSPADIRTSLITSAEGEAWRMFRYDFVGPSLNRVGYTVDKFTIRWLQPSN